MHFICKVHRSYFAPAGCLECNLDRENQDEADTLRSRVAELEGLLREAQTEIVASVEHSHCHRVYVDGVGADQLVDRIDDALDASGIDTSNVKGGE